MSRFAAPPLSLLAPLLLALASALAAGAGGAGPVPAPAGEAVIAVLDVGQGDAILVRSPEGKMALVDAGPSGAVVEQLRRLVVERLDLLAISHHHLDHYAGADEVIDAFQPRVYLASASSYATPQYVATASGPASGPDAGADRAGRAGASAGAGFGHADGAAAAAGGPG